MQKLVIVSASILGALGVILGAYGAHGLEKSLVEQGLDPAELANRMRQFDIAVRYHMIHALALLTIGLQTSLRTRILPFALILFVMGLLLFCGGLYSMALVDVMGHWSIVPAGGACFILAWLSLALAGLFNSHKAGSVASE